MTLAESLIVDYQSVYVPSFLFIFLDHFIIYVLVFAAVVRNPTTSN